MKRRIQPLQQRCHLGYEYTGQNDPSRMSEEDIDDEEDVDLYFLYPPPPGANKTAVDPRQPIKAMTKEFLAQLSEEEAKAKAEAEEEDDSEDLKGFSDISDEDADTFELKPRTTDKAGASFKAGKRPASSDLADEVPAPPKKKRSVTTKKAVKKIITAADVPPRGNNIRGWTESYSQ
ncbi:unnamed protein product [Urochloa decumbens]|uniref:Uncharacterized protein n=1 Tax=Urochloa decumbens TaxID=240449 RepID=A0ABC9BWY0_9POAL